MTGTVTYEGQPVERGVITLTPVAGRGTSEGAKILRGEFQIEGIAPGTKQVSIIGVVGSQDAKDQPISSDNKIEAMVESTRQAEMIPTNAIGNGQTIRVEKGMQAVSIELSRPTQP